MKLTSKQIDKLWGETGPYSEIKLITQTRVLDDRVGRIFVQVELYLNPLTYELVKQNRDHFKNEKEVLQIVDQSEYLGGRFGYVSCPFSGEYFDENVMKSAKKQVEKSKEVIIKMHKFVLEILKTNFKR